MDRLVLIHHRDKSANQLRAFKIRKLAQIRTSLTEVAVAVGITTRTAKRALLGDLNGQCGLSSRKKHAPGAKDVCCFQDWRVRCSLSGTQQINRLGQRDLVACGTFNSSPYNVQKRGNAWKR